MRTRSRRRDRRYTQWLFWLLMMAGILALFILLGLLSEQQAYESPSRLLLDMR